MPADGDLLADERITGEVLGVVYADADTGFGVVELALQEDGGARCSGPLSDVVEGQTLTLVGRWRDHPRYGRTFESVYYEQVAPSTVAGLRSFLASERFEHVPERARLRVLTTFGAGAGRVIEHETGRLVAEAGLDPDDAEALHEAWMTGQALGELVRLVEPAGWPMDAVRAAHARFGTDAARLARQDPYRLLEAERVRFAHADALARSLGIAPTDPRRLAAGARAAVAAARRGEGHQHLPREECVRAAMPLLRVDAILAAAGVDAAVAEGALEVEEVAGVAVVSTPAGFAAERDLADGLARLLTTTRSRLQAHLEGVDPAPELTTGQADAVRAAFASPVSVLTGGPGTGKTRTVQEIVRAAEEADLEVALCAPTGRAAKRLEELVGRSATTVHRLLEARPVTGGGFAFRYGEHERLPQDLLVVDEVSMCDTWLAGRLVRALDDGAHLVLVGDPDQLPSVGPGDVLRDVLRSSVVPSTVLTEIHRQAAGSRIVGLAREVLAGTVGVLKGADGDVFLAEEARRPAIVPRVVEAVAERAPAYFGVEIDDVQVLAPMYKGPAGVHALNAALKERLNPADGRPSVAGFHVGDRVMQTRNDPELDVANGDVGRVVDLSRRGKTLRVAFPRGEVTYDADQARDLVAAWAVTVHKSQGGEWPVVVLVCDRSHRIMLWRNLVYTAVTRAQRALIVVGQAEALRAAARHDRPSDRRTGLAWRLEQADLDADRRATHPSRTVRPA
ncbi:SF1B family DNA helicase RecD2 [Egicoccus halophilus]|uniref:ATP-dependent RecD2 DNA helicase n=1 Tax=Egicoccus halophilus TaxID=1670830 RepID=A0A8J3EU34_9ACTN|nr:AAA family ATPase [Egicoccus halophilus]GGI05102.1 ATP-dependent RecD-like DNA helicase [Egicoccus halophilus]